jgi:hypothetical protein
MIDLFEKITVGVCALFFLVTAGVYFFFGLPSPKPLYSIPKVIERPVKSTAASRPATPGKVTPVDPEIQNIIKQLQQQERPVSAAQVEVKGYEVPQPLFEYLATEANVFGELKKAKSKVFTTKNGNTRLQVYDIREQSYLGKLGFQNDDIVELIDGQIVEFNESSSAKYYDLWSQAKRKLRQGEPVSVTVTRRGRPVHLKFQL